MKTPWSRAAAFYWAFLWRTMLIFCGMSLPFFALYGILKIFLDAWPLFEHLFRLACILAEFTFASCFAIQWAAQASFRGNSLRILETTSAADSNQSSSSNGITMGRAGRLFGAHLWRYLLVVVPVNFVLISFVVGTAALLPGEWLTVLKVQSINFSIGFIVGVWAMREALSRAYRGFRFQWIAGISSATSNVLETPPSPSVHP